MYVEKLERKAFCFFFNGFLQINMYTNFKGINLIGFKL